MNQPPSSPPPTFPLRWESTGEQQWWYVYPIDLAAAKGYYEIVRELVHIDPNLLIKLTSLRRIQRLETVWDSDLDKFKDVAKCRAHVAKNLLRECDTTTSSGMKSSSSSSSSTTGGGGHMCNNTLIRAGYGGWILYTALSAGDVEFVKELLDTNPVLVFGEGEFGITDLFYAAGRSKCDQVFKLLLNSALSMKSDDDDDDGKWEIINRGLHGLATSGNVELLKKEVLMIDHHHHHVLDYRDCKGSTILHAAAGKGQLQVVKHLITAYPDMTDAIDNLGNKPLHIAAYGGYTNVIDALLHHSPTSASSTNNHGDTFLHTALTAFQTLKFHTLDLHHNLIKQLVNTPQLHLLFNLQNNQGKTPLHLAVSAPAPSEPVVIQLLSVDSINLNLCDRDGLTPLDLLRQRPNRTATSELLIKKLVSAGAVSSSSYMLYADDWRVTRSEPLGSHLRHQGPADSEIFEYSSGDDYDYDYNEDDDQLSSYYSDDGDQRNYQLSSTSSTPPNDTNRNSNSVTKRLKQVFQFTNKRNRRVELEEYGDNDNDSSHLMMQQRLFDQTKTTTLRERFTNESSSTSYNTTALANNKRVIPINFPMSPVTPTTTLVKKFSDTLPNGVGARQ